MPFACARLQLKVQSGIPNLSFETSGVGAGCYASRLSLLYKHNRENDAAPDPPPIHTIFALPAKNVPISPPPTSLTLPRPRSNRRRQVASGGRKEKRKQISKKKKNPPKITTIANNNTIKHKKNRTTLQLYLHLHIIIIPQPNHPSKSTDEPKKQSKSDRKRHPIPHTHSPPPTSSVHHNSIGLVPTPHHPPNPLPTLLIPQIRYSPPHKLPPP